MWTLLALLAQAKDAVPEGGQAPPFLVQMLPLIIIFVLFWFLIILPGQRRERQQREQLMKNLKKNDEVVTQGGLIGIVANINEKDEQVTLKLDESSNARVRVLRSSIVRILTKEPAKEGTGKGPEAAVKE